jgi:small subunit ribosomal protein S16
MPVKIRLSRKGRKKSPFYHIVIADARSPRDGKFIEKIGTYNPMTKPATIEIDRDAAFEWLGKGAQPTDTVRAIMRFKGVFYKKHLLRGVSKGSMTVEQADVLWKAWIDAKESKIDTRRAQTAAELESLRKLVSGEEKKAKQPVADAVSMVSADAFKETAEVAEVQEEAVVETQVAEVAEVQEEAVVETQVAEVAEAQEEAVVETQVAEVAEVVEDVQPEVTEAPEAVSEGKTGEEE